MPKPFLSFIDPHKNPDFREIIASLNETISHGDNLERIDFPGLQPHMKVFSTRENIKGRFIFVRMPILQEMHFILVKHLPSHEYDKFKRENLAYILKKNLPLFEEAVAERQQAREAVATMETASPEETDFERLKQQFQQFVAECSPDGELHLLFSDLHQKPIVLTEKQREICYTTSSLLIKGNPGSGKTLLLFAQLGRFIEHARENNDTRPILYIAPSSRSHTDASAASLIPTLRRAWHAHPASQHLPCEVAFFTFEEFIARFFPDLRARLVPPTRFYDWFAHFSHLKPILSTEQYKKLTVKGLPARVYQELCLIAGLTDDSSDLNEIAYFAIGKQDVLFPEADMRTLMLQITKTYLRFLSQESLIDLALNPPSFPSSQFQRLLLDELQDCPLALFKKIIPAASHVTCCMDSKQSQQSMIPKEKLIQQFLIQYDTSAAIFNLIPSFRCPSRIVDAANRILGVNNLLANGTRSKNESPVLCSDPLSNGLFKIVERNRLPDDLIRLSYSADFLPIYFAGDDPIPALAHRHHALANQVNGLELSDGALLLSQKVFGKISRLLKQLKEQGAEPSFNRAKDGQLVTDHILLMNALFTAATRFSRSLWLVVENQTDLEGLLYYLNEPEHLTLEEEKGLDVKVSTPAEWRARGNDYRDKGLIEQAREAFINAGLSPDEIERALPSGLEQETMEPASGTPKKKKKKKKKPAAAFSTDVIPRPAISTPEPVDKALEASTCSGLSISSRDRSSGLSAFADDTHLKTDAVKLKKSIESEESMVNNTCSNVKTPKQRYFKVLTHSIVTELIKLFNGNIASIDYCSTPPTTPTFHHRDLFAKSFAKSMAPADVPQCEESKMNAELPLITPFIEYLENPHGLQNVISAIAFDILPFKNLFYKQFNIPFIQCCLTSMNGQQLINFLLKNPQGELENHVVNAFRLEFEKVSVNKKYNVYFFDLPYNKYGRKLLKKILKKHPNLLDSLHPSVMELEIKQPGSVLHTWATLMPDLVCFISEHKWEWLQQIPLSAWIKNDVQFTTLSAAIHFVFLSQYFVMDPQALDTFCEYLFAHIDASFWVNAMLPLSVSEKGCQRLRQLLHLRPELVTTLQDTFNHFLISHQAEGTLIIAHLFNCHTGREIFYDLAPNEITTQFWTRSNRKEIRTASAQDQGVGIQPCVLYFYLSTEKAALQLLALMEKCPKLFLTLDYMSLKQSMSVSNNISFSLLDLFLIEGSRKKAFDKLLSINPTLHLPESISTHSKTPIHHDIFDKYIVEDLVTDLSNTDRFFSNNFLNDHIDLFLENKGYLDLLRSSITTSAVVAREQFTRAFFHNNEALPYWSINEGMNISLLLLKRSSSLAPHFLPLFFKKCDFVHKDRLFNCSIFHFWAKSDNTLLKLYKIIPDFIKRVPENIWLEEHDNLTTFEALWDEQKLFLAEKVCEAYPFLVKKLTHVFYRPNVIRTQFNIFKLLEYIKNEQCHLPRLNAALTEIMQATDETQIIPIDHLISRVVEPRLEAKDTPDLYLNKKSILAVRHMFTDNESQYLNYLARGTYDKKIIEPMRLNGPFLDKDFLHKQFNEAYIRNSLSCEEGRVILYFLINHLDDTFKQRVFHLIRTNLEESDIDIKNPHYFLDELNIDIKNPNYFVILPRNFFGCKIFNLFLREHSDVLDKFQPELWSEPLDSTQNCLSFLINNALDLLCFIAEKKPNWLLSIPISHWTNVISQGESAAQKVIAMSLTTIESPGLDLLVTHLFTHCHWQTWVQPIHYLKASPLEILSSDERGCNMLQTLRKKNPAFDKFLREHIHSIFTGKATTILYLSSNLVLTSIGRNILFELTTNIKINNKFWTTALQPSKTIFSNNLPYLYAPPLYHLLSTDPSTVQLTAFIKKCPNAFKGITREELMRPIPGIENDSLLKMARKGEKQRRALSDILAINTIDLSALEKIEYENTISFFDFQIKVLVERINSLTEFLVQRPINYNFSRLLKIMFTSHTNTLIARIQTASQESIDHFSRALLENEFTQYFTTRSSLRIIFELFKRSPHLEDLFSRALSEEHFFQLRQPPVKCSMMSLIILSFPCLLMEIDEFRPRFLPSLPSDVWFKPIGCLFEIPFIETLREDNISLAIKIHQRYFDHIECIPVQYWLFPDSETQLPRLFRLMDLILKKQVFCFELNLLLLKIITKIPDQFWTYFFHPSETRKDLLLREYILDLFIGSPEGLQKLAHLIRGKHCSFEESLFLIWCHPSSQSNPTQLNNLVSLLRAAPASEAKNCIIEHLLGSPALKPEEITPFRKLMRSNALRKEYEELVGTYKEEHTEKTELPPSSPARHSRFFRTSPADENPASFALPLSFTA